MSTQTPTQTFKWHSAPGDSILRVIREQNISIGKLKESLNLEREPFLELLHGSFAINTGLAKQLAFLIGGSAEFWMKRDILYRESIKDEYAKLDESSKKFINSLSKLTASSPDTFAKEFRIRDLSSIKEEYVDKVNILFSKDNRFEPSPAQFALWLRQCEKIGENKIVDHNIELFSADKLLHILPQLRTITRLNNTIKALEETEQLLRKVGVILVKSPAELGSGIAGATKRLLKNYRFIIVTDRYKTNAAIWQTVFHELAHCVLHSLDETVAHYSDSALGMTHDIGVERYAEQEAVAFVEEVLFPEGSEVLKTTQFKSYKDIIRYSLELGISTSLLFAKLHRLERVPYSWRGAFRKVSFDEIS